MTLNAKKLYHKQLKQLDRNAQEQWLKSFSNPIIELFYFLMVWFEKFVFIALYSLCHHCKSFYTIQSMRWLMVKFLR